MAKSNTERDTRSARQVTRKAIPLEKAHIHDTAVGGTTDFLEDDITPSDPPCLFRIMIQIDTAAKFHALVDDGEDEVTLAFNGNADLVAGALYIFDMLVNEDDNVNFQVDDQVNVDKFIVQEILWGTQ